MTDLLAIVSEMQPMTVRQVFYQAVVRGLIEKDETGYDKVQRALLALRRDGRLPYHWIADNTRWQRKPTSFRNPREALDEIARFYRKALWADLDIYVEMWLEKDALASVVYDVTAQYDVPLMVARGFSSETFLYEAAENIETIGKPAFIYHIGDHDPSGVAAAHTISKRLREMAPAAEIAFESIAVTPAQIEEMNLPKRPTKGTDSRSRSFAPFSVEVDAIAPSTLRGLVRDAIERHMPSTQLLALQAAEESERDWLRGMAALGIGGHA